MKLTQTDKLMLSSYASFMDGLAAYLGSGYELVLHSLESEEHSVIKIINGFHSGRAVGAPINAATLETLKEFEGKSTDRKFKIYFTHSKTGVLLKSASLPVFGESNTIIGLLCINFYTDTPISTFLELFSSQPSGSIVRKETFGFDTHTLILDALSNEKQIVYSDDSIPAINKNKVILSHLYEKGIFKFKEAVSLAAANLGISKNTVYLHLRSFERNA